MWHEVNELNTVTMPFCRYDLAAKIVFAYAKMAGFTKQFLDRFEPQRTLKSETSVYQAIAKLISEHDTTLKDWRPSVHKTSSNIVHICGSKGQVALTIHEAMFPHKQVVQAMVDKREKVVAGTVVGETIINPLSKAIYVVLMTD